MPQLIVTTSHAVVGRHNLVTLDEQVRVIDFEDESRSLEVLERLEAALQRAELHENAC